MEEIKRKRGRPKKEKEHSQYLRNNKLNNSVEGRIMRPKNPGKKSGIYNTYSFGPTGRTEMNRFEDARDHLFRFVDLIVHSRSPIGLVYYNFSKITSERIYRYSLMPDDPIKYLNLTNSITDEFVDVFRSFSPVKIYGLKVLAYHCFFNLDIRKYMNLSVIYQIINQLQNSIFKDQVTIWWLECPSIDIDPCIVLHVLFSNPAINHEFTISTIIGMGFDILSDQCKDKIEEVRKLCTSNDHITLKPITFS